MCLYDRRVGRRSAIARKERKAAGADVRSDADVAPPDLQQLGHEAEVELDAATAVRGTEAALDHERAELVPVS